MDQPLLLYQDRYICIMVDQADCAVVDLFVHSSGPFVHSIASGPFGGPFFVWGGGVLQNQENPPGCGLVQTYVLPPFKVSRW